MDSGRCVSDRCECLPRFTQMGYRSARQSSGSMLWGSALVIGRCSSPGSGNPPRSACEVTACRIPNGPPGRTVVDPNATVESFLSSHRSA
jgi:hypothetical protein